MSELSSELENIGGKIVYFTDVHPTKLIYIVDLINVWDNTI